MFGAPQRAQVAPAEGFDVPPKYLGDKHLRLAEDPEELRVDLEEIEPGERSTLFPLDGICDRSDLLGNVLQQELSEMRQKLLEKVLPRFEIIVEPAVLTFAWDVILLMDASA